MKKTVIVIIVSIAIGVSLAIGLFRYLGVPLNLLENRYDLSLFQVGVYHDLENANSTKEKYDGSIIYEDNGLYRVYIAAAFDEENINLLKDYYKNLGINYYLKNIKIDENKYKEIKKYEDVFAYATTDAYSEINSKILEVFLGV